jgi:hypothetical protein
MDKMEIKSDTNAAEALKMSKKIADVFREYTIECLSCKGMPGETIEKIAFNKGLALDNFLSSLNNALKYFWLRCERYYKNYFRFNERKNNSF